MGVPSRKRERATARKGAATPGATIGKQAVVIAGSAKESAIATAEGSTAITAHTYVEKQVIQRDAGKARRRSQAAARQAYLAHVLDTAGRLSLSGVDPRAAGAASESLELQAVYTALRTTSPRRRDLEGDPFSRGADPSSREPDRLSALEKLDRHAQLVLLGDPGSGKSTFLHFAAVCLAGEALGHKTANLQTLRAPLPDTREDRRLSNTESRKSRTDSPLQPWSHGALLPVRIVLRDFAARGLPPRGETARAQHLRDFLAEELRGAVLGDFVPLLTKELRERGGLILLDGLDEVPEADHRRVQIKQAVEELRGSLPKCRFLVTSRTYAYQKQDWHLAGFAEAELAPFEDADIARFVQRWYAHVGAVRGFHADDARGRAAQLDHAIRVSPRLLELARRPLLLTLMASLHAWRGGSLPEHRAELYEDAVNLLLDWWEGPKVVRNREGQFIVVQPSLVEWMKVDKKSVRRALDELAYTVHASQPDVTGAADVRGESLIWALMQINKNTAVNPAELVEYLSVRAGLLVPRGHGVFAFPHRTLQEYLAACHLTRFQYPYKVADCVRTDPDRWRETALLAAARAAETPFALWALVDRLCPEGARQTRGDGSEAAWAALVAGQALAECGDAAHFELEKPRVARVACGLLAVMRASPLPALERARAGDLLGQLGDPRFSAESFYLPSGPDEPLWGFVEVPEGAFWMGSDKGRDPAAIDRETPQHEVPLGRYFMARYPVTVAQFRAFVEDSGHTPADPDCLRGRSHHPVVWVQWEEAMAYAKWLTRKLRESPRTPEPIATLLRTGDEQGRRWQVRLPDEAEWEKAARGKDGRIYPWGDEAAPERANHDETGLGRTSAVGCFPRGKGPYGLEEASGNVWEWTCTPAPNYQFPKYPWKGAARQAVSDDVGTRRVVRGGAFSHRARRARCAIRHFYLVACYYVGFRVAVSPSSEH